MGLTKLEIEKHLVEFEILKAQLANIIGITGMITLKIDHIAEKTAGHNVVFDNDVDFHDLTVNNITGNNASSMYIKSKSAVSGNTGGAILNLYGGDGYGSGLGGSIFLYGGEGGATGHGGNFQFEGGSGGVTSGDGGWIGFKGGDAQAGNENGGDIFFIAGFKSGSGSNGEYKFYSVTGDKYATLDFEAITGTKTFSFPDSDGTIAITGAGVSQDWLTAGTITTTNTCNLGQTRITDPTSSATPAGLFVLKDAHLNIVFDRTDTDDAFTYVCGSALSGMKISSANNDFFIGFDTYANRNNLGTGTIIMEMDNLTGLTKFRGEVEVGAARGSAAAKIKLTSIGGYAIKLINTTGATSVIGQTVKADPNTNDAVILTAADDPECIGVFLNAVADDAEAWVVVVGIADVTMEDNTAATRGNWVQTSETEAGYADATSASPKAAPQHFNEIGHCIESVSAGGEGNHILARCVLHFN